MKTNTMKIRITLTEEMLGTASFNPELHDEYIASKAPDAQSREEEVAALGVGEVIEKGMTGFPRDEHGNPILWDYQIKGFFKDTAAAMKKIPGSLSAKVKAYKKEIDGLIFPQPRKIVLNLPKGGTVGDCQRPLRASTPQGERVALAHSESVPAGTWMDVEIVYFLPEHVEWIEEMLDFGCMRGLGQWRNSGKGRFQWEKLA